MNPIVCLFGTRPEAIKLLPVDAALRAAGLPSYLLFTSQHATLVEEVFDVFARWPDRRLPPRTTEGLGATLAAMLPAVLEALTALSPRAVLVQGDTLSAFVGGLCAFLLRIPVGHIEGGLRSGQPQSPFPEEMLRRSLSSMASVHFVTTAHAHANLLREGVQASVIRPVGNTVHDALHTVLPRCTPPKHDGHYRVLLTLHRRETEQVLRACLLRAIGEELSTHSCAELIFPAHPTVYETAYKTLADTACAHVLAPLGVRAFYEQLLAADLVLTDSGGVQEEAAYLGIPTLVLRDVTEREAELSCGAITLVGREAHHIREVLRRELQRLQLAPPVDAQDRRAAALRRPCGAAQNIAAYYTKP